MKKIAILTWHDYNNFGSVLQTYALQEAINSIGINASVLNYLNSKSKQKKYKRIIKRMLPVYKIYCKMSGIESSYKYSLFRKRFLRLTKECDNLSKLKSVAAEFDAIVVGSDQIWAPNVFDSVYMLDFLDGEIGVKKVAYAASVGLNDIPTELAKVYSSLLSDFDAIAVRESMGKALLAEKCGISSQVVLDPTFLLNRNHYFGIMKPVDMDSKSFVFCYFLNANHEYKEKVLRYAKKNNLTIYGFSAKHEDAEWMQLLNSSIGPLEFLWLVKEAKAVFTDSYHGTIFSLLFHKEFYLFERFDTSDPICQNSRIYQLKESFGIDGRIMTKEKECSDCSLLDYDVFDDKLQMLRNESIAYLKEVLH